MEEMFSPYKYAVQLRWQNVSRLSKADPDNQRPDDWSSTVIVFRFLAGQEGPSSSQTHPPPSRQPLGPLQTSTQYVRGHFVYR